MTSGALRAERRVRTAVAVGSLLGLLLAAPVGAQSQAADMPKAASTDHEQPEAQPQPQGTADQAQDPPAAVGEAGVKPTRGFGSALAHNLLDDVRHLPRRNSAYWLAGGTAFALVIHPADHRINAHLVNQDTDAFWTPGHVIGSTPFVLGAAVVTYVTGRARAHPRLQHLGMDEMEATLLANGLTQVVKMSVRRERPARPDGQANRSFSFPSGHAMTTFAAATVLQQHLGYRAAIPTYLVASWVAMSRLHDNRHYASDVVAGAAAGIIVGRSVTFHGRNVYASPLLLPDGAGVQLAIAR